jgi:hypothetical protein
MAEKGGSRVRRLRCAIYTRKSSDEGLEQEFNSLHAQREACEAYILSQRHEGWHVLSVHYDDGGYSGGTMDRPALQRLLAYIGAGKVDVVVVYKIDRLTRSLFDFAKIVEAFDASEGQERARKLATRWLSAPDSNLDTQREYPLARRIWTARTRCGHVAVVPRPEFAYRRGLASLRGSASETEKCSDEEEAANPSNCEELRPDHIEASPPIENRLGERHEVGRG